MAPYPAPLASVEKHEHLQERCAKVESFAQHQKLWHLTLAHRSASVVADSPTISATAGTSSSMVLSLCCAPGSQQIHQDGQSPSVLYACMVSMEPADPEGVSGVAIISPTRIPQSEDSLVPTGYDTILRILHVCSPRSFT